MEYEAVKELRTEKGRVRIHRPGITEEERAERMKKIKDRAEILCLLKK